MTVAALNTAILDGRIRLLSCPCTVVVIEARAGGQALVLEPTAEAIVEPGMVAVNPDSGGARKVTAENVREVAGWHQHGRVTVHHVHECKERHDG